MTLIPPELPSFQSFVESTKVALSVLNLPERCSSCASADARAHPYQLVDLHRHEGESSPVGGPQDGLFWAVSEASTTCESSSDSSCSCDDSEDQVMLSENERPGSPSSVSEEPCCDATKPPRRAYATKKKYLTEQQRYEIVCRVLSGEKQAHVARDYGVTRAAVSYLLKHHSEIMHRVLTMHANCCLQRAAATAAAMDTSS